MKSLISTLFFIATLLTFTIPAFSQDTSQNQQLTKEHTYPFRTKATVVPTTPPIYRDTRLGGSSPYFNTYRKNDFGAGAITTDPNKAAGVARYPGTAFDSGRNTNEMYHDTRLGGSSPHHRTYQSNDYGAGAITTDPNK